MANNFFQWDQGKYSIEVPTMDKEHQQLIAIMNKLYEKHSLKASKQELATTLKELGDFVVKHFKDEEEYFSKIPEYSKKEVHKKIHQELISKFTGHVKQFEKEGVLKDDFFTFLKVWLTAHIAGVDMNYGKGLVKKAG
ncbi:MAG: bacteriohemerythrin [Bdellovibrionaceae bacterium]|nr:bacteriohemerythrin [Pseudobdellovibrionaceae bacterium]NUM59413.1 hemerythrin family protein [Pseudobdellovibrionaceae bacterium]